MSTAASADVNSVGFGPEYGWLGYNVESPTLGPLSVGAGGGVLGASVNLNVYFTDRRDDFNRPEGVRFRVSAGFMWAPPGVMAGATIGATNHGWDWGVGAIGAASPLGGGAIVPGVTVGHRL